MSNTKKDIALSTAKIKAVSLEDERTLRVIATTSTLDRDLEQISSQTIQVPIKPKGLKYLADMTPEDTPDLPFLIDHEWALEKQAGSVKSIYINADGETETIVKLSTVDNGERVYTLAKEGHLGNSFSIGYSLQNATLEDGMIKNIEMLELSAVFKGSNRDARLLDVKSVQEKSMALTTEELEAKQAELAKLTKEIEDATVVEEVEQTPAIVEAEAAEVVEEAPAEEVIETPVVEEAVVEEAAVEEEQIKEEQEITKMAHEEATKSIVPAVELPSQEVAVKTITQNEARKMIVNGLGAKYAKDDAAFSAIEAEMAGVKVINGTTGAPLYVEEILAQDIRDQYELTGRVGSLVNRIDIEGAETFRQLVETAGNGFLPVALGAVKQEDAPTWTSVIFEPFEWALIVAWLDGVQKRSPIAVYNQVVRYIAKEYAKLEDKIVLTYAGGTVGSETRPATGLVPILTTASRVTAVANYGSAALVPALGAAYGAIESDDTITLVANRKTWASLATSMDANDHPIFSVVGNQVAAGALGTFNVVLSQVLEDGDVVVGAFADYNLVTRGGLGTLFSREAVVGSLNLFTQDASALRADVDITGGPVLVTSFQLLQFATS